MTIFSIVAWTAVTGIPFSEGRRFVSFHHVDELRICASCGLTEVHHAPENHKPDPEWYCSSLCRETETLCQEIYERPYNTLFPMQRRMV